MSQMPFIPFGPWAPDRSEFNTKGTEQALNVIRTKNGYRPFPGLADAGFAALVSGQPTGLFNAKDTSGIARQFAAVFNEAVDTGIYELDVNGKAWNRVGTVQVTSKFRFQPAQFDDTLFITNFTEGLRSMLLATGTDFDPVNYVGGAGDGLPVKPKFLTAIRDIMFGCFMDDPILGPLPNRCQWSGLGQPDVWSYDGDEDNLSDFQDVPNAGDCRGIVGGEYGTLLMEHGVFRVDFVGPPAIFTFQRIENARGCSEPNSVVTEGQNTYYLSDDGWAMFDGQTVVPFGAEVFDRWFSGISAIQTRDNMTAKVDPQNQLIIWGFDSQTDATDINDSALIYDYAIKEPSYARFPHSILGNFVSPGYDIDDVTELVISDPDGYRGTWRSTTNYLLSNPANPGSGPDRVSFENVIWEAVADSLDEEPVEGAFWTATAITASIDDLTTPLDGVFYKAGAPSFGCISQSKLNTFTGVPDVAQIDTSELRLGGEKRARVQMVQTAIEGDAQEITVQIGTRNRLGKAVTFGPERELTGDGQYSVLQDSRYQRVRVNITSLVTGGWRDATGVFVRAQKTSLR